MITRQFLLNTLDDMSRLLARHAAHRNDQTTAMVSQDLVRLASLVERGIAPDSPGIPPLHPIMADPDLAHLPFAVSTADLDA